MSVVPVTPERGEVERKVEALRQQGGIFVDAVRATRMPILVTDAMLPGNPVIFANDAFLALSGYAMDEVLGQQPHFLDGPQADSEAVRQFATAIAQRRDESLEVLQHRKDGSTFWAAAFVSPRTDEHGQVIHHFLSFLDITRRRETEVALRRLNAELEQRVDERTRELTEANAHLTNLNTRLTDLVAQNEVLMREVNHRAKNSLALASALLSVQAWQQADPTAKAALLEAQARLVAIAQVFDLLGKSEDGRRVDLVGYLRELCSLLVPSDDRDARIRLTVAGEGGMLVDSKKAVSLGLVVNELVTNAVKHAFPPPRAGTIEVQARRLSPERGTVHLRDNGIGMPPKVREGSLGFKLVRALVEQVDGEIAIDGDGDGDGGVEVTLTFPL
jgi:PAS domain S-box-containing protein